MSPKRLRRGGEFCQMELVYLLLQFRISISLDGMLMLRQELADALHVQAYLHLLEVMFTGKPGMMAVAPTSNIDTEVCAPQGWESSRIW